MINIFFLAAAISSVTLLLVIFLTHKYNFFLDKSDTDKPQNYHEKTTPRAGGIGILAGLSLILMGVFGFKLIPSIILAFFSGIFEDLHNSLRPQMRLFLQFIAALTAIILTHSVVTYLGLGITLPYWLGVLFSLFAIVGMMNAINIIDGFNGLASSTILIILLSFAIVTYQHHNTEMLYIITITAGATFGFFLLNFPKGKIFLGDGGAYLLGFIVSIIGIFLASTYEDVSPWYVLAIFIYPVWEVIFSIFRKSYIGLSPMQPDRYHLHMLIYRQITKSNPGTTLVIVCFLIPSSIYSTLHAKSSIDNIFLACTFIFCYLVLYAYLRKKERTEDK